MRARRATSARRPSESGDSSCLLAAWGPNVHSLAALLVLGCPRFLSRPGELDRNLLDAGGDLVERFLEPQVGSYFVVSAAFAGDSHRVFGVVLFDALLADELVD